MEDLYNNKDCCRDISDAAALDSIAATAVAAAVESQSGGSSLYDDDKRDMNIISCSSSSNSFPQRGGSESKLSKSHQASSNSHYKQHTNIEHSVSGTAQLL